MKLDDIQVGEDYAIRWGGGPPLRGTVTYAGRDRQYIVSEARVGASWRTGPRVFFTTASRASKELDTSPSQVIRPWAEEQVDIDAAAAAVVARDDRLAAVEAALGVTLRWDYNCFHSRYSTSEVVVALADLERLAADR